MRLSSVRIRKDNERLLYYVLFLLLSFAVHHRVSSFAIPARPARRTWEESFQFLKSYKETYGDCNVPTNYPKDKALGNWAKRQRTVKLKLSPEQREALDAIGYSWDRHETAWNEMYTKLKEYKEKHGDCSVPESYNEDTKLRNWVITQRKSNSKLSPEQRKALDDIGFDWDPRMTAWNEMFARLTAYKEKHGDCNVSEREDTSLRYWVQKQRRQRSKLSENQLHALTEIGFEWDPLESDWQEMFRKLKAYIEIHGDCNFPHNYTDTSLVSWVAKQRRRRLKLTMHMHQTNALEEIGFDWDPHETAWCKMYQQLLKYREEHGHCRVPHSWPNNTSLAHWVQTERLSQKQNKIEPSRLARLNAIRFTWSKPRRQNNRELQLWAENYEKLEAFKSEFGHCHVPITYHDKKLAWWVRYQRKNQVRILQYRRELLDSLGFEYNPIEADWQEQFARLKLYKKEHGNCIVPQIYPDDQKLGIWVSTQRKENLNKKLSIDRRNTLDSIGFEWDPFEADWQNMFECLKTYKQKHGHCNVPRNYAEKTGLGSWVSSQRMYRQNMSPERQQRLESIGFDWNPLETYWNRMYDKLVAYRNDNGNCLVPTSEPNLGKWVSFQRRRKSSGKIDPRRERLLDEIGFVWSARESSSSQESKISNNLETD
jgi:hypothetical protein